MLDCSKFLTPLVLLIVAGCGTVPISSIYQLRKLDLQTTDLTKFYAAVRLPESLEPRNNGVSLDLGFKSRSANIEFSERIVLERTIDFPSPTLAAARKPGYRIYTFKVKESDMVRLQQTRDRIKNLRDKNKDGSGSLAIEAAACKRRELPEGPLYLSTYINGAELEDFVVMVSDYNIRKLGNVDEGLKEIPSC